jgi:tetratricopeptide (TPR) repeat protein
MLRRRAIAWPLVTLVLGILAVIVFGGFCLPFLPLLLVFFAAVGALRDRKDQKLRLHILLRGADRLRAQGDREQVFETYREIVDLDPTYPKACLELGNYYRETGHPQEAAAMYQSALQGVGAAIEHTRRSFPWRTLSPIPDTGGVKRTTVHMALSDLYEKQGQLRAAIDEAQAALRAVGPTEAEWWLKRLPKQAGRIPQVLAVLLAVHTLANAVIVAIGLSNMVRLGLGAVGPALIIAGLFEFLLAGVEVVLPVAVWTRLRAAGYGVIGLSILQIGETILGVGEWGADSSLVVGFNIATIIFDLLFIALAVLSLNEYGKKHFASVCAAVHLRIAELCDRLGDNGKAAWHRGQAEQLDPIKSKDKPGGWDIEEREPLSRNQKIGISASIGVLILLVIGGVLLAQTVGLAPGDAVAYLSRGNTYADSGDLEQAILSYDKAIDLNPEFTEAYFNRGYAYHASGDPERAILDYDKAIDLDPLWALAYLNRGVAHIDSGNPGQAIADLEHYLELAPDADNREAVADLIEQQRSALAEAVYVHPTGAFEFVIPAGWELFGEDDISALISDGESLAAVEFHDVQAVYTEDDMRAYVDDFVARVMGSADYQTSVWDVQRRSAHTRVTFTASDGGRNSAEFLFAQWETVIYAFLYITPADAYEEMLPTRDAILDTYQVDPEAAIGASP